MLSFIRPNEIPSFAPFYTARRNYTPEEGEPYIQQDSKHWFVKILLPDVDKGDFLATIKDSNLILSWRDSKKIQHRGRIYSSSEVYEKSLEIPPEITEEDMKVHWEKNTVVVAITKPQQKLQLTNEKSLPDDGVLMKMNVPEEGDHSLEVNVKDNNLLVTFETSGKREQGEGDNKYYSTFRNKIQRTIPVPENIDPSDIESQVENGQLIVRLANMAAIKDKESKQLENRDTSMEDAKD